MLPNELEVLLNENKWEEAIEYISHLGTPLDDELLSQLAWCNSRAGRYDLAIELYDEMIQRQPQKAKWYYSKGYQFYMQKKWQDAVALFEKALNLFEDFFIVKYRLAYAYIQISGNRMQWSTDSFWKAIKQLEDCHKIFASYSEEEKRKEKSTYADICALHGKTIMASERYLDKSIGLLKQASGLKPDDNDIKYQLSKAYYAKKLYNEALESLPNVNKPYYIPELRAQILFDMGEYAKSNSILLDLVKFRKKDYIYRRIAENYIKLGLIDEAEKNSNKAIDLNHRNYKNYFTAGLICLEKEFYKSSVYYFEKSRTAKAQQYNMDCTEAVMYIDKVNAITNNNPMDPVVESPRTSQYTGQVIKYNAERGFGFLKCSMLAENVFFHISNYPSQQPIIGSLVAFEIETTKKGIQAVNITSI